MKKLIPFTFAIALLSSAIISACPACGTNIGGFGKTVIKETVVDPTAGTIEQMEKVTVTPIKTDKTKRPAPGEKELKRKLEKGKKPKKVIQKPKSPPFTPASKETPKKTGWFNWLSKK